MIFLTGLLTFIATELDDFAVFVLLFSKRKASPFFTFLGQFLGLLIVTLLCIFISQALLKIPQSYLRFLGIIPLALGIKYIIFSLLKKDDDDDENDRLKNTQDFIAALLITLSASGDNLGVYISYFTKLSLIEKFLTLGLFSVCQGIWSFLQYKTSTLPAIQSFVSKTSTVLIPVVFISLGLSILFL